MNARSVLKSLALSAVLALPAVAYAQAPMPAGGFAESIKGTSTIQKIDSKTREVSLKRADGSMVTIVAGEEVRNFDQMKVGDIVETEIVEALAVLLEPAHSQVRERRDEYSAVRAQPGQKPGGKTIHTVDIVATVQDIDAKARTVTVKGALQTVTLKVADEVDLSKVKKGDNVRAVYVETVSIQVKAPTK